MNRALRVLVLGTVVAVSVPGAARALPPAAVRLERAVAGLRGLRADFVQIRIVELTGEEIEATGFLAFRPPGAIRLAFTEPEVQEIVVAGDSLWVHMPADAQALRYPFDPGAPGSEIFLLFGGRNRTLESAFEVTQEPWADHPDALRLVPRDAEPGYPIEEIRVLIGDRGLPERLFYREAGGDHVVFRFTRIVRDPEGIEAMVRLELPPGTDIIDAGEISSEGDR